MNDSRWQKKLFEYIDDIAMTFKTNVYERTNKIYCGRSFYTEKFFLATFKKLDN